jgi:hypothetical protein
MHAASRLKGMASSYRGALAVLLSQSMALYKSDPVPCSGFLLSKGGSTAMCLLPGVQESQCESPLPSNRSKRPLWGGFVLPMSSPLQADHPSGCVVHG